MIAVRRRDAVEVEIVRFAIERALKTPVSQRGGMLSWADALRWDPDLQAMWRAGDRTAQALLYPSESTHGQRFTRMMRHVRRGPRTALCVRANQGVQGLVVFQRDCSVVAVAQSLGRVAKVMRRAAGGLGMIEKEVRAHRLLPEHTPAVIEHAANAPTGGFPYLVSEYVGDDEPVTPRQWPRVLPEALDVLFVCYRRAGLETAALGEALEDAVMYLEPDRPGAFDARCRRVIERLADVCRALGDQRIIRTTVHGDLTPENVRRGGGALKLIDWSNGGRRCAWHDLFIQEFYRADPAFWGGLLTSRDADWFDSFFFGAFRYFAQRLETLSGSRFSLEEVRANLVLCLLETAVANYERYRVVDPVEGAEFFEHIEACVEALCAGS